MSAGPIGSGSSRPTTTQPTPATAPTMIPVAEAAAVAPRQRSPVAPLYRTIIGSVAVPREAFRITVKVMKASENAPNARGPNSLATYRLSAKLLALATAWSMTPQPSRPAVLETSRRAVTDFTLATVTFAPQVTAVA